LFTCRSAFPKNGTECNDTKQDEEITAENGIKNDPQHASIVTEKSVYDKIANMLFVRRKMLRSKPIDAEQHDEL